MSIDLQEKDVPESLGLVLLTNHSSPGYFALSATRGAGPSPNVDGSSRQGFWKSLSLVDLNQKLASWWGLPSLENRQKLIHFVTKRPEKFAEVKTILSGVPLIQAPLDLPTLEQNDSLPLRAAWRVLKAFEKLRAPCFIEEAALNVEVSKFPKPFPGYVWREVVERMGRQNFACQYHQLPATTLSAFAFTYDGLVIHVFTGSCKGQIVCPTPAVWQDTEHVDGWDVFFSPEGFHPLTLAQLRDRKHLINMRWLPCAEMRSRCLRDDSTYSGVYEIHVTVHNNLAYLDPDLPPTPEWTSRFQQHCRELGVKPLYLTLPSGRVQLQTAHYTCCVNYTHAMEKVRQLALSLNQLGFPIQRLRLEAMLHNRDCPHDDHEALLREIQGGDGGNYFEFHARLSCQPDQFPAVIAWLEKNHYLSEPLQGLGTQQMGTRRVSWSTSHPVSSPSRFFVNMKVSSVGVSTALQCWRQFLQHLTDNGGFAIAREVKPEYCVYDEKPLLDHT